MPIKDKNEAKEIAIKVVSLLNSLMDAGWDISICQQGTNHNFYSDCTKPIITIIKCSKTVREEVEL